jgi:hypothetical protein
MTIPRPNPHASAARNLAGAIGFAAAITAAAIPSHAAEFGQCDTPENMSALFRAEGQKSVGIATLAENGNAVIFTAGQGIGYVLVTDKPPGTKATRICVNNRLESVRLLDARKPGVPDVPPTSGDVNARCATVARRAGIESTTCGTLKAMLSGVEPLGERVMMTGRSRDGVIVTITANLQTAQQRGALLYTWMPEGATMIGRVFTGTNYTDAALAMLDAAGSR